MPNLPNASPPGMLALLRSGDLRALLTRHADVGLAAFVVGIVAMMIIPLPPFLLDLFITLNIAVAVVLLLISIYVGEALKIATFPTLLLITTLFRLAIEVSATRLILLKGNAGHVIAAFGNFVVSGNLVVGAVIFLILTMIQFLVIAKGSERVAEVGARFTLDAMPGKQMSIDAELRAGHIDHKEARRRRLHLARESQFFGSMDGAMKFVKGDAIAGIIILCINIAGGLVIGIVQRDMDAATAARTYTILTIGGGLIAQIPALIISTAAGILVTRVASDEEGSHLGRDIGLQILAQPKALAIAAAFLALFAVVPGFPATPFLLLALLFGVVAYRLMKRGATPAPAFDGPEAFAAAPGDKKKNERPNDPMALPSPVLIPVSVDIGPALSTRLWGENDTDRFTTELVPALRQRWFADAGLPLAPVRVRRNAPTADGDGYVIRLKEVAMGSGRCPADWVLAAATASRLSELGIATEGEAAPLPDGTPGSWVSESASAALTTAGIACLGPAELMAAHLFEILRRHGHELFGLQETQALLDGLEASHPAVVREVVPKLISHVLLTDVLRRLAEENVSLRALRDILQVAAIWAPSVRDPVELTERIRAGLRRQLSGRYAPNGTLVAFLLDPMIEDTIRESIRKTDNGSYLALAPELSRDITQAIRRAISASESAKHPVILTTADIRRYVRRLIDIELPEVAVLSYQELVPDLRIAPVNRIGIA
ncbi:MAG: type III secretion system export apparatus subunit SctV [Deltaproteobacteria bacterium]|nr:type III secretion system export apparatus subunit SctV [Deltaproteobacteria bacterium]